jgi:hypothetical protein
MSNIKADSRPASGRRYIVPSAWHLKAFFAQL